MAGYRIYRNGSYVKQVTGTSTTDTGLAESTTHSYRASAIDNAGNQSAQSNIAVTNTPSCPSGGGNTVWAEHFPGNSYDSGNAVTVDSSGNIIVTGYFEGMADFGGGMLTGGNGQTLFIAKYSSDGTYRWAKSFGSEGDVAANAVAVDSDDNIIVAGSLGPTGSTVNFGGGTLRSLAPLEIVIAKFSSAGTHRWSKIFNAGGYSAARGIAIDSHSCGCISDEIVITGDFQGNVSFGGTTLNSGGQTNTFIAKFSSAGMHQWSTAILSPLPNTGYGVAIDSSSHNVVVTGSLKGTAYLGDINGDTVTSVGMNDIYVTQLSPAGDFLWAETFGTAWDEKSYSVAIDNDSNIAITGTYNSGPLDLGGGPLPSNSGTNIFVAKFSSQGLHLWSKGFLASGKSTHVAVDDTGNVLLTGYFFANVDFGGGVIDNAGSYDAFVAKYASSDGEYLWADSFGGTDTDIGNGVAVDRTTAPDSEGKVVVTGFFQETVNFGGIPLTSTGPQDIFLIKLEP
jgi:hypothetical protein